MGIDQSGNLAQWAGDIGTVGALFFWFPLFQRECLDKNAEQANKLS